MIDPGAALHVCPLWFGAEFPLATRDAEMSVTTADGTEVQVHGLRTVYFAFETVDGRELSLGITFTMCDMLEASVSFSNPHGVQEWVRARGHHKVRYVRDENARLRFFTNNRLFYIFLKNVDAQDEFILHHEEYASEPYRISACDGSVMMNTSGGTTDSLGILQETRNHQKRSQKRQTGTHAVHNKAFTSRTEQLSFQSRRLHYTIRGHIRRFSHMSTP